tara:strand:- start:1356 stop:1613 length:258 start_codon:yes stop_codon:yes gene_type:complete
MKVLDIREIITKLGLEKGLCKSFAEKTGRSEEEFQALFNDIFEKEINNISRSLSTGNIDESKLSRLRGLSLQDFLEDNDKIIKDK